MHLIERLVRYESEFFIVYYYLVYLVQIIYY